MRSTQGPIEMKKHAGAFMNCTGKMMCPEGSGSFNFTASQPCLFTRKLKVLFYSLQKMTYLLR